MPGTFDGGTFDGEDCVRVTFAAEMAKEINVRAPRQDAVIMAAAVSDFRPRRIGRSKHKKAEGAPDITFVRTADILAGLGRKKSKRLLVGFAAETGDPVPSAIDKLKRKKVDLVVANDVSQADAGFEVETNRVHLVDAPDDQDRSGRTHRRPPGRLVTQTKNSRQATLKDSVV